MPNEQRATSRENMAFPVQTSCVFCKGKDFTISGPRSFFCCTCCQDLGFHRCCIPHLPPPEADWFCSFVCRRVHYALSRAAKCGTRCPSLQILHFGTKGHAKSVQGATELLQECFQESASLLAAMCTSYISDSSAKEDLDFSMSLSCFGRQQQQQYCLILQLSAGNFRIAVITQGQVPVSVALFR